MGMQVTVREFVRREYGVYGEDKRASVYATRDCLYFTNNVLLPVISAHRGGFALRLFPPFAGLAFHLTSGALRCPRNVLPGQDIALLTVCHINVHISYFYRTPPSPPSRPECQSSRIAAEPTHCLGQLTGSPWKRH